MLTKMNLEKPPVGYFSEIRFHETSRPPPLPEKTYEKPKEIDWDKVPLPENESYKKFGR